MKPAPFNEMDLARMKKLSIPDLVTLKGRLHTEFGIGADERLRQIDKILAGMGASPQTGHAIMEAQNVKVTAPKLKSPI